MERDFEMGKLTHIDSKRPETSNNKMLPSALTVVYFQLDKCCTDVYLSN